MNWIKTTRVQMITNVSVTPLLNLSHCVFALLRTKQIYHVAAAQTVKVNRNTPLFLHAVAAQTATEK
jgi:hypothetical protein